MASDYSEVVDRLLALHEHDQRIAELEQDLAAGPRRLDTSQGRVQEIDQKISAVDERARILKAQIKLRENDLKAAEQKIERLRAQSSEVRTNKEFVAFKAELANYQADADRLQSEILKILDVVEQAAARVDTLSKDKAEATARVDTAREAMEASLGGVKKARDDLVQARGALQAGIPAEALAVYERVLRSRGSGLSYLEGEYCGACMERLTKNDVFAVQNQTRLVVCRGCNRVVVLRPV